MDSVAEAFNRKSHVYDAFGRDHPHLTWMRQRVYAAVEAVVPSGAHMLEINAGTGWDAVNLVRRGYRIHATDLAPEMVAAIRQKITTHDLSPHLTAQQLSFTALSQVAGGPYDAVFSNFGGLNCIPNLRDVTRHLPAILKPGGVVVWVVMPPVCPWELALTFKDPAVGMRRLRRGGTPSQVEGVTFTTYYPSARQVQRAFPPEFQRVGLEGLGVLTPSADNKTFAKKHPALYKALTRFEMYVRRWPLFRSMGDFFILTMRYAVR